MKCWRCDKPYRKGAFVPEKKSRKVSKNPTCLKCWKAMFKKDVAL